MKNRKIVLFHIIFWVSYTILNHFVNMVQSGPDIHVYFIDSFGKYFVAAFIFYTTTFFILPHFFKPGRYIVLCLCILAMYFVAHYLKVLLYDKIFIHFNYPESPYSMAEFFFMNIWWWSQYTLFSFGYWFAMEAIKKQKTLRLTEQKQLKAEQEKLALENAHLRAQINPHFLFNTLGFLYNQANKADPELAEGIIALTSIMRSAIRKPSADGRVSLAEEIENITQLIRIYELRYNHKVFIIFNQSGNFDGLTILPHVLITLVENALKHGDIHKQEHPLMVHITISDSELTFRVHNRKRFGPKDSSHGIGIHYLQRQLTFAYKDKYAMDIIDEELFYTTTLTIQAGILKPNYLPLNNVA